MDKRIYLCLAHMSGKEMGFIQEAFDTNWVVPLGPNVNAFEQDLERFVGRGQEGSGLKCRYCRCAFGSAGLWSGEGRRSDSTELYLLCLFPSGDLPRCYSGIRGF